MKKARLSVYLDPEMMAQLTELADQKQEAEVADCGSRHHVISDPGRC